MQGGRAKSKDTSSLKSLQIKEKQVGWSDLRVIDPFITTSDQDQNESALSVTLQMACCVLLTAWSNSTFAQQDNRRLAVRCNLDSAGCNPRYQSLRITQDIQCQQLDK